MAVPANATSSGAATDGVTESFLSGRFHHVDLNRIEKELFALWSQADQSTGDESVTRASSLNFILFSTDSGAEVSTGELLAEITLDHPARALLALAIPSTEETLEAWVTARCHFTGGKKRQQICCEQITVRFEGKGTEKLASVVLPLTMGDLPTCMYWQTEQIAMDELAPFLGDVDRLIVDSRHSPDLPAQLDSLVSVLERLPSGVGLYDLEWQRILPARMAIANSFGESGSPLSAEDLDLICEARIDVACDGMRSSGCLDFAQPLLLAAWLASRLGWVPVGADWLDDKACRLEFRYGRKKLSVRLQARSAASLTPGTVIRVSFSFINRIDQILSVEQIHGSPGLVARLASGQSGEPDGDILMAERSIASLIGDILDESRTDSIYLDAVRMSASILEQLRTQ